MRGRTSGGLMWLLLAVCMTAWAMFLWHPWIDWFGRAR
jgi:hypothetical protein